MFFLQYKYIAINVGGGGAGDGAGGGAGAAPPYEREQERGGGGGKMPRLGINSNIYSIYHNRSQSVAISPDVTISNMSSLIRRFVVLSQKDSTV
jgi:hypothetical protein